MNINDNVYVGGNLSIGNNQLLSARLENLATQPISSLSSIGRLVYNTSTNLIQYDTGTIIQTLVNAANGIVQGGNSFGAPVSIGSIDAFDVNLKRGNVIIASLTATGFAIRNAANTFQAEFQNAVTANRIITIPDSSMVIVGDVTTQKLTNKTVVKRTLVVTQSATPATNIDLADIVQITGQAQAITSMSSGLIGTPYDGQMIMWQITDNGTLRAITWGPLFASTSMATLPSTTTFISTMLRVITQYNSVTAKHECQFVN